METSAVHPTDTASPLNVLSFYQGYQEL